MVIKRPPLGWNSWNTFGWNINEDVIKETADAFIDQGLKEAGYEYVVIDDCWSERERDAVTNKIIPDKVKFPNGMNHVSDYVHSKGLKFGMYSCAGIRTCADFPGSFDHEFLDAETFAEYGVDFLKYDFCYKPEHAFGPNLYKRMGLALKACGRDILFSACNWGADDVHKWIRSVGAHMYRSTGDICDNFDSFKNIAMSQLDKLCYSAPGCYNDTDMLTVGMYGKGNVGASGCDDTDYKTQFALWCMMSAPLMLGCDVRSMNEVTRKLVTNTELLKINQDEESRPPVRVQAYGDGVVLFKHLADGEYAFGFFNLSEHPINLGCYFEEAGLPSNVNYGFKMTDIFSGECVGVKKERASVRLEKHDCTIFRAQIVRD